MEYFVQFSFVGLNVKHVLTIFFFRFWFKLNLEYFRFIFFFFFELVKMKSQQNEIITSNRYCSMALECVDRAVEMPMLAPMRTFGLCTHVLVHVFFLFGFGFDLLTTAFTSETLLPILYAHLINEPAAACIVLLIAWTCTNATNQCLQIQWEFVTISVNATNRSIATNFHQFNYELRNKYGGFLLHEILDESVWQFRMFGIGLRFLSWVSEFWALWMLFVQYLVYLNYFSEVFR